MNKDPKQSRQLFEEAADAYLSTVKAGIKAQEDAAKQWMDLMKGFAMPADPFRQGREAVSYTLDRLKEATRESFQLMEQNAEQSLDLMSKGLASTEAGSMEEAQAQFKKMWEDSLKTFRTNVDMMLKMNSDAAKAFTELAKKQTPPATK